jgi:TolA-binding protein
MIERDAIEQALGEALAPARAPVSGDGEMLRRLVDRAVAVPPPVVRPRAFLRVLGGTGGGLAIAVGALLALSHRTPHASLETLPAPAPVETTAPNDPAAQSAEPVEIAAPIESSNVVVAPTKEVPARELYARANEARRIGRDAEAAAGYRTLQRLFPTSTEALASHMSLGRMLLDRRHDPSGALVEFDRYIASGSRGELREEALIGRARALGQLDRREDERGAWKALLREFPRSMYADQARERIAALGG